MKRIINIQVNGQVQWKVGRTASGHWIAECEPLGLTTEGESSDELIQNIEQSVQLLMEDLMDNGELESFLHQRGWKASPIGHQQEGPVEFQVPTQLLMNTNRDSARALLQ